MRRPAAAKKKTEEGTEGSTSLGTGGKLDHRGTTRRASSVRKGRNKTSSTGPPWRQPFICAAFITLVVLLYVVRWGHSSSSSSSSETSGDDGGAATTARDGGEVLTNDKIVDVMVEGNNDDNLRGSYLPSSGNEHAPRKDEDMPAKPVVVDGGTKLAADAGEDSGSGDDDDVEEEDIENANSKPSSGSSDAPPSSDPSEDERGPDMHEAFLGDYYKLREEIDQLYPEDAPNVTERRLSKVQSVRGRTYLPLQEDFHPVDDCPLHPPSGYPHQWAMTDILKHWNPDDPTPPTHIYQGICVFNYTTDLEKAMNYLRADVPFVLRDDPEVLATVERWNHEGYMSSLMGSPTRDIDYSASHHFMYYDSPDDDEEVPEGWDRPTDKIEMTYDEWHKIARRVDEEGGDMAERWYYQLSACGPDTDCDGGDQVEWMFEELPYFQPKESIYKVDPFAEYGIDCRFGMKGVIAECHYDTGTNFIALLSGERRYILASPDQCSNLHLYPDDHPSARQSSVNWSNPDMDTSPRFAHAKGNEIVLQAGDVLHVPSHWFHFIVSLNLNYQCNSRSGISERYSSIIEQCSK